jgi:flagellar biosynthesis GTPase FlhF
LPAAAILLAILPAVPVLAANGDDEEYVVIKAGRVITVSGEEFAPGTVVIADGKISAAGGSIEYPPSARVIDARGETVMPGFVLPRSRYGLGSYKRTGVHGDQNVASEIFLSQMKFDDLLEAGYATVCFVPSGAGIPGLACAFRTAGPDEERKFAESTYLEVATDFSTKEAGKALLRGALKKAKEEIEKVEKARKEWEEKQKAKQEEEKKKKEEEKKPEEEEDDEENGDDEPEPKRPYDEPENDEDDDEKPEEGKKEEEPPKEEKFEPPPIDPKHQPLVDLIQKKEGALMMVRLGGAADLHHLDDVLEPYDDLAHTLHIVRWGGWTDFNHVVDQLGEREARIVLRPLMHMLSQTTFRYNLWAKLAEAGCELSAIPLNESRTEYLRVRQRLAELVRAGLSREAALKSLTLYPARAIGLGDRLGSLEKDKDADLVFLNGDPLDPHTKIKRVMILGEIVWTADEKR